MTDREPVETAEFRPHEPSPRSSRRGYVAAVAFGLAAVVGAAVFVYSPPSARDYERVVAVFTGKQRKYRKTDFNYDRVRWAAATGQQWAIDQIGPVPPEEAERIMENWRRYRARNSSPRRLTAVAGPDDAPFPDPPAID